MTESGTSITFDVNGTNTYQLPGTYPVTITVQQNASATSTVIKSTAVVIGSVPMASGTTFAVTPGVPFNGAVANFTDTDPLANKTNIVAVINWGDGHISNGAISGPDTNGLFTVSGQTPTPRVPDRTT